MDGPRATETISKDDSRSAEEVLDDHLLQGQCGSIDDDLVRNYAEDVVVLSARGVFRGHGGLRQMQQLLRDETPGAKFTYHLKLVEGEVGFLESSGASDKVYIRDGVDSYVIRRQDRRADHPLHHRATHDALMTRPR